VSEAAVIVDNVLHRFGSFTALDRVSLDIETGEFVVLLGPSGSGKTTLLSILGGFIEPSEGRVFIEGQDMTAVPAAARPTITVFQDYALFPHKSVRDNVGFGLDMRKVPRSKREARIEEMLDMVGLGDAGPRKPHELSGGQRQRIALARALAVEPSVLLLDEPLGALDLKLRRQMQDELKEIQRRVGTTFIHVTHDQEEAMAIADTVVVMNDGKIEDQGVPERVYLRPRSIFAATFMGDTNLIEARVGECGPTSISVSCELGDFRLPVASDAGRRAAQNDMVVLSVRPEHFAVKPGRQGAITFGNVRVEEIGFVGTHHQCRTVHETVPSFTPQVHLLHGEELDVGAVVPLFADPRNVLVFPSAEAVAS
jgi:spermidine/putrescine transport system ATP-binding protein